jgi:hypothetical protein
MANLIIYNSNIFLSKMTALEAMTRYKGATVKDVYNVNTGTITAYINGLVDEAWDHIVVCVDNKNPGGTSLLTETQFVALEAKISASPYRQNTSTAGAGTSFTLDTGASSTDDEYNNMWVLVTGGAGANQARFILDYNGTTKVCTVDTAFAVAPGAATYIITSDLMCFSRTMNSVLAPRVMWNTLNSDYPMPLVLTMISGQLSTYFYPKVTQTCTSVNATTLTHTGQFTLSEFNSGVYDGYDFYCGIESSSTKLYAAGQVVKIASNTANVLTFTTGDVLDPVPTGTVVYQICRGDKYALYNVFLPYGLETRYHFAGDTVNAQLVDEFLQLIDRYDGIAAGKRSIYQDNALLDTIAAEGKIIFDAINKGATT